MTCDFQDFSVAWSLLIFVVEGPEVVSCVFIRIPGGPATGGIPRGFQEISRGSQEVFLGALRRYFGGGGGPNIF